MSAHKHKRYFTGRGKLIVKPYRIADLCAIYGVGYRTMRRWIEAKDSEVGQKDGNYYTTAQVKCIVKLLGVPHIARESERRA
jgi:hypothetical protein